MLIRVCKGSQTFPVGEYMSNYAHFGLCHLFSGTKEINLFVLLMAKISRFSPINYSLMNGSALWLLKKSQKWPKKAKKKLPCCNLPRSKKYQPKLA